MAGADEPMRSPAKPYQNAIASAVQIIADRKNSLGRGKNETNMFGVHARVRDLRTPLQDTDCAANGRNTAWAAINVDHQRPSTPSSANPRHLTPPTKSQVKDGASAIST